MTYRVVKKIKGNSYLYEQETYRDNSGQVKTISRYIGAVSSVGDSSNSVIVESQKTAISVAETLQKPPLESSESESKKELTLQNKLTLSSDLSTHRISQPLTESESRKFIQHLNNRGIKSELIPSIKVVPGRGAKLKKRRNGTLEITIPKKKTSGARAEFKQLYQNALAHCYLDALEQQDKKYFSGLKGNLKEFYSKQNSAIVSYINYSNRKSGFKLGLTLHFLMTKMVSAWTQKNLAPERLGLTEYSKRRTWREDSILIMSEIQKDGWSRCYKKYMDELSRTERIIEHKLKEYKELGFMDGLSGKKRTRRKEIRRLNARRKAVYYTCDKISILAPLYSGYKEKELFGDEPFLHFNRWSETRRNWKQNRRKNPI